MEQLQSSRCVHTAHRQHLFPRLGPNHKCHIPPLQPKQLGNVLSDGGIGLQGRRWAQQLKLLFVHPTLHPGSLRDNLRMHAAPGNCFSRPSRAPADVGVKCRLLQHEQVPFSPPHPPALRQWPPPGPRVPGQCCTPAAVCLGAWRLGLAPSCKQDGAWQPSVHPSRVADRQGGRQRRDCNIKPRTFAYPGPRLGVHCDAA